MVQFASWLGVTLCPSQVIRWVACMCPSSGIPITKPHKEAVAWGTAYVPKSRCRRNSTSHRVAALGRGLPSAKCGSSAPRSHHRKESGPQPCRINDFLEPRRPRTEQRSAAVGSWCRLEEIVRCLNGSGSAFSRNFSQYTLNRNVRLAFCSVTAWGSIVHALLRD